MKALVATMKSFGPPEVLEFKEVPCPKISANVFLLKGQFATVTTADVRIRSKNIPRGFKFIMSLLFGFRKPKFESLGTDYVGQVVELGAAVTEVKRGDRVVVDLGIGLNGYRTYRSIKPNDVWVKIPDQVPSDIAVAAVFGGVTACIFLKNKLKVQSGDRVLVIGAGGAVGSSAVQLAKVFGAEVVAVCSAAKSDVVKGLGATVVFDHQSDDWQQTTETFDVFLDCVGVLNMNSAHKLLKPGGRVGFVVADLMLNLKCILHSIFTRPIFISGAVQGTKQDLQFLMDLIVQGKYSPLIGKRFSFFDVVKAHHEVETGHRLGATLLSFGDANSSST